jgi:predicted transglutaminase-like cysteine proteinase
MRQALLTAIFLAGLTACASTPDTGALVRDAAPRVSEFQFNDGAPLSAAGDFEPWAVLTAGNAAESQTLEGCIAGREACETAHLRRYRALLELARDLEPDEQLKLVQEYFNSVHQTLDGFGAEDWGTLYRVASTHEGDCKAIAAAKYFTLRRLGFPPDDLRLVMNWDDREQDWHALLAVREDGRTFMLDSILGPQDPSEFTRAFMVYSISEEGIWDHAPGFVPVP